MLHHLIQAGIGEALVASVVAIAWLMRRRDA